MIESKKEANQYLERIESGERLIFPPEKRKLALLVYNFACNKVSGGVVHKRKEDGNYEVVANWVLFSELHDKYAQCKEVQLYVELYQRVYLRRGDKL